MKNLRYISIVACLVASPSLHADTITLKSSVRLAPKAQTITLADVAELTGEEAQRLGTLVLAPADAARSACLEIPVADVRAKLDAAGIHWGRVNLNGRIVIVRPSRSANASIPLAMTPAAIENAAIKTHGTDDQSAADLIDSPTVRGMIANLIVSNIHVKAADLRLVFDRADAALLNTALESARFEVQPQTSFTSDRINLEVRTWADGKVQKSQTISVKPLMRVQSASLRRDIDRDQSITKDDLETTQQWLPPSQAAQTSHPVAAIGRVAVKNLQAGDILRDKNIRRDALVKRGDMVIVRCLVGGVAISLQAEARADGAAGDSIEFRKHGERETFLATISARGEATLDLTRRQSS